MSSPTGDRASHAAAAPRRRGWIDVLVADRGHRAGAAARSPRAAGAAAGRRPCRLDAGSHRARRGRRRLRRRSVRRGPVLDAPGHRRHEVRRSVASPSPCGAVTVDHGVAVDRRRRPRVRERRRRPDAAARPTATTARQRPTRHADESSAASERATGRRLPQRPRPPRRRPGDGARPRSPTTCGSCPDRERRLPGRPRARQHAASPAERLGTPRRSPPPAAAARQRPAVAFQLPDTGRRRTTVACRRRALLLAARLLAPRRSPASRAAAMAGRPQRDSRRSRAGLESSNSPSGGSIDGRPRRRTTATNTTGTSAPLSSSSRSWAGLATTATTVPRSVPPTSTTRGADQLVHPQRVGVVERLGQQHRPRPALGLVAVGDALERHEPAALVGRDGDDHERRRSSVHSTAPGATAPRGRSTRSTMTSPRRPWGLAIRPTSRRSARARSVDEVDVDLDAVAGRGGPHDGADALRGAAPRPITRPSRPGPRGPRAGTPRRRSTASTRTASGSSTSARTR